MVDEDCESSRVANLVVAVLFWRQVWRVLFNRYSRGYLPEKEETHKSDGCLTDFYNEDLDRICQLRILTTHSVD